MTKDLEAGSFSVKFRAIFAATCLLFLFTGCAKPAGYTGPKGPLVELAVIEVRRKQPSMLFPPNDVIPYDSIKIVAVDEVAWNDGKGATSGTLSPGLKRLKIAYQEKICKKHPITAGQVATDVLLNAPLILITLPDPHGPSTLGSTRKCDFYYYGFKGIYPLNAEAGKEYLMNIEREGRTFYVQVIDKTTKAAAGNLLYYENKLFKIERTER